MSTEVAFRSSAPEVLAAWEAWKAHVRDVRERRAALAERYGRRLMVNRLGFGHGTRVVGFEEHEDDQPGALLGNDSELRVPKLGRATVVPNTRRKAGKDLAAELATLSEHGPELPGMPSFQLVGLRSLAPALFGHDGVVWAMWSDDIADNRTGGALDLEVWEQQPLSAYHLAHEAHEASQVMASEGVPQ